MDHEVNNLDFRNAECGVGDQVSEARKLHSHPPQPPAISMLLLSTSCFRNMVLLDSVLRSRDQSMSLVFTLLEERKRGAQDHAVLVECFFGHPERRV